jgi:predicted TIM-barrel fold metal-dependent hydrolase
MKNPFGDQKIPGSYHNLKERMFKKVKAAEVDEKILTIMMKAYEDALYEENVVLSRAERKRLFSQIVKMVMEDMLYNLDRPSTKAE